MRYPSIFQKFTFTLSLLLSTILPQQNLYGQYCPASNTECGFEYITNFNVSNINNNSACDAPYDNFTTQVATMMRGLPYNGTVTKNGAVTNYLLSIYVDWNQNNVFDITGEEFQGTINAAGTGFTFSITPPAGALLGNTRMRVRMVQLSNTPAPCGAFTRGDLEDYTVNVILPAPPANDACANALTITPNGSCVVTNGTTINGTQQYPPTACSANTAANANDVWYSFVADGVKDYTISTTGVGNFNPVLALYSGCGTPTPSSCSDATGMNGTEIIAAGVLPAGTYYYRIYGNGGTGNFTTCVTFPGALTYCGATSTDCGFEYITNFTLVTINNNSACDAPYDDFTSQVTTLAIGQNYNGTISKNGIAATYLSSVYIDWNQNGTFDLPTEEIQANPNAATTGFDFAVTPPAGALLGNTRMRVRMVQFSNTPTPCGPSTRGDLEDYTINVTNIVVPPNDDCVNSITVSPTTGCTQVSGFTTNGGQQLPPTNCSGTTAAVANDVWYKFTANGTNAYQIQASGTGGFDPVLAFYTGCTAASMVICKDTSGANQTEIINAGVLPAGTYYYRIYGKTADGTFNTCVMTTSTTGLNYCTATSTDCDFEYITFVGLTTIGNTTDCGDPYDDYTNQVAYIMPGQSYTGHIKKNDVLATYSCSVFIDWNKDGVFDVTETINATATGTSTYNFTVLAPLAATLGSTRMRVRMVQNGVPAACGSIGRGDLEDYTINLSNTPPPSPPHNNCSGAIPISPNTTCGEHSMGSTVGATQQFPPQLCDGSTAAAANDVWFSFQANGTSGYQITINPDGNFDPVISLYNACSATNRIACEDKVGAGLIENLFTGVLPSGTYYYRVYGKDGNGTFAHCIKELIPQDEYDCQTARVLCSKDPIAESAVLGYGLDGAESYGSCLAAGVGLDANTEENSKWYTWTAANNGNLTFDIIPRDAGFGPTDSLDVDFVLYELDPNVGCAAKIQLRCMASSCKGPTGLNAASIDFTESPDCLPSHDGYLQQLTQQTGRVYALMVNNFDLPSRGYDLYFGGTAEFVGIRPGFTTDTIASCVLPRSVTVTDTSINVTTYQWNFGAGATPPTATTAGPHTISYSTPGTKTITLIASNGGGCDSTLTKTVVIADTISATTVIVPSTCEQPNGQVTVNKTGGSGQPATFTYSLDGGAAQASNNFTGLTPGSHMVTITDSLNCAKSITFNVPTSLVPIVDDIIDLSACDNYTLPTITGTNLTGNESYYTGPNGTGTAYPAGSIITANTMIYIHDSTSSTPTCRDQEDFLITINTAPTVTNIVISCNPGDADYTVSFEVNGGDPGSYAVTEIPPGTAGGSFTGNVWTSGNITSGTAYNFEVDDVNGCGPVVVSGVRSCNCATQVGTMGTATIRICGNGPATATYNNAGQVNDGNDTLSFVLHNQSGGALGTVIQTSLNPTFSFIGGMTYGTTYYISAINGNDDGTGATDLTDPCLAVASGQPVIWRQTPTASFSGTATICAGASTPLTFNFTGVGPFSVTYSNGVTNTTLTNMSNGSTVNVTPTQTRTYTLVSVVSSSTTCTGTVSPTTVTVTVNTPPTASAPSYTCNPTNTGYTASITFSGGNGGPYNITGGPGGSFTGNVYTTNEIPSGTAFSFQADANGCGPITVSGTHTCNCATNAGSMGAEIITLCGPGAITATHNTGTVNLDGNDLLEFVLHTNANNVLGTVISTNGTPTFSFIGGMVYGTTYYISAIAGNNNGSGNVDQSDPCLSVAVGTPVEWRQIPTTTASVTNNNICVGQPIDLFATNSPGSFSWTGPASFSSLNQNPTRPNATAAMSGDYIVTVTTNNTCSSSSTVSVTVNPVPNTNIATNPAGPFCEGAATVQFTAATAGGTWSGNGITDPTNGTFDPTVAGTGIHTITYSIGGSCPNSSTKNVTVNPTPMPSFDASPINGCAPLLVNFVNTTANASSATWTFGNGQTSNSVASATNTYAAGTYDVTLSTTVNGCTGTLTQSNYISVNPQPVAGFTTSNLTGDGKFVFTNTTTNGTNYLWDFGDGETGTDINPTHDYQNQTGSFTVTLTATNDGGCTSTFSTTINIAEGVIFYIPNAFTPDGDAMNHYFSPVLTAGIDLASYKMSIFNRWGQIVFETSDVNIGWDGTFNNAMVQDGLYTWSIKFGNLETDQKFKIEGTVQLIR